MVLTWCCSAVVEVELNLGLVENVLVEVVNSRISSSETSQSSALPLNGFGIGTLKFPAAIVLEVDLCADQVEPRRSATMKRGDLLTRSVLPQVLVTTHDCEVQGLRLEPANSCSEGDHSNH